MALLSCPSPFFSIKRGVFAGRREFSCVCLHGDRKPQERKGNLEKFKVFIQELDFILTPNYVYIFF